MLLPELGAYIPLITRRTLFHLREVLLSFYFLRIDQTKVYDFFNGTFGFESNGTDRNYALIENGSSFMNCIGIVVGILIGVFFFFIMFLIQYFVNLEEKTNKWWGKVLKELSDFAVSLRIVVWYSQYTYMFIVLISMTELQEGNKNGNTLSTVFAVLLMLYSIA